MIADTACFSFLFPFFSLFLLHPPFCFFISPCCFLCIPCCFLVSPFLFPCISLLHPHPVGAGLCSALPQNHQHHSALPHKIINLTHLFMYNTSTPPLPLFLYIFYLPFASPTPKGQGSALPFRIRSPPYCFIYTVLYISHIIYHIIYIASYK